MKRLYTYLTQLLCDHDWVYPRPGQERICIRCHRAEVAEHSHLGTRIIWRKLNYWLLVHVSRAYRSTTRPTLAQLATRAQARQRRRRVSTLT